MRIKIDRSAPLTLFVRIKGPLGVRELRAVVDTGSSLCTIPITDAREIGYEAFYDPIVNKGEGLYTVTQTGILEVGSLTLEEVTVGNLTAKDVQAVVCNLPRMGGIDMILGLSFISQFKMMTLDYESGFLTIA